MNLSKNLRVLCVGTALVISLASMVGCSNSSKDENKKEGQTTTQEKIEVKEVKGEEALKIMEKDKDALVIDVRDKEEYEAGHIKDAINISVDEIEDKLDELKGHEDKAILVYCNSGKKSGKVAKILVENGFKNVSNVEGVKDFKYDLVTK